MKIEDCPFCGAFADLQHHGSIFSVGQRDGYRIECANCAAKTCYWHTAEQAKNAWNQRAGQQQLCGEISAFRHEHGFRDESCDLPKGHVGSHRANGVRWLTEATQQVHPDT